MKTIISDAERITSMLADALCLHLQEKPETVLALPVGRSVKFLYDLLLQRYDAGQFSLKKATVFSLGEFMDTPEEKSCKTMLWDRFLSKTDLPEANCHFPDPMMPEAYDRLIDHSGGIQLALLGLGENAHIAFNEPATPFSSRTHVQKLSPASRRQYGEWFGGESQVPERAVTMGISDLCGARSVYVIATGEKKADAVYRMLYGRTDSVYPAAFLQIPMNACVYLDKAASSLL